MLLPDRVISEQFQSTVTRRKRHWVGSVVLSNDFVCQLDSALLRSSLVSDLYVPTVGNLRVA